MTISVKPAQDLKESEQYTATHLAAAEQEDDERKGAISAGTRKPLAKTERPFIEIARGRTAIHSSNVAELGNRIGEAIAASELIDKLDAIFDALDEEGDGIEERFWSAWISVPDPDQKGRLRFYPTPARSDYGNPSFDRNRSWWDRAGSVFRIEGLTLPTPIEAFREEITGVSGRYGATLDRLRFAEEVGGQKWKELVALGRKVRKDRRTSRSLLREDFDGQMSWVNELVPPPGDTTHRPTTTATTTTTTTSTPETTGTPT